MEPKNSKYNLFESRQHNEEVEYSFIVESSILCHPISVPSSTKPFSPIFWNRIMAIKSNSPIGVTIVEAITYTWLDYNSD